MGGAGSSGACCPRCFQQDLALRYFGVRVCGNRSLPDKGRGFHHLLFLVAGTLTPSGE